jgi:hypothetical protein
MSFRASHPSRHRTLDPLPLITVVLPVARRTDRLFGMRRASLGDIISCRRRVGVKSSDQSW